jgi:ferredoxin-nitrate reductase
VRSRRGTTKFPAKITKAISPGTVFVHIHWGKLWADDAEAPVLYTPRKLLLIINGYDCFFG